MRAAIKARTAELGIEKSKVTADYIKAKTEAALQAGPGGMSDPDQFGGLDLSQISSTKKRSSDWNEDMPSMFYDPDEELTLEEREEIDPIMKKSPWEQAIHEMRLTKWPTMGAALKEVVLVLVLIAVTGVLVIYWDKFIREIYTSLKFIPTKEGIADYASRFDGLDLPKGWTDGMSEEDLAQFADKVNSATTSGSSAAESIGGSLPDL